MVKKKIAELTIGEWKAICKKNPYGICRNCPFFKANNCPSHYLKLTFDENAEIEVEEDEKE